jgi:biopolymer transport protein ExbD
VRLHLALLAGVLLAAGCSDLPQRDPPPSALLEIAADGGFRLDGRPIAADRLDATLRRMADEAKDPVLQRSRLRLGIRAAPGTPWDRVTELQDRCIGLGIVNVETAP